MAALGCGGDAEPTEEVLEKLLTMGPSGGTIALGGVTITVPAGALASDTQVGVEYVAGPSLLELPDRPEGLGGALAGTLILTPHGTRLAQPIQISVPTTFTDNAFALLRLADDDATEWTTEDAARRVGTSVQFSLHQFSTYSLAAVAEGACPCWNAKTLDAFDEAVIESDRSYWSGSADGSAGPLDAGVQ